MVELNDGATPVGRRSLLRMIGGGVVGVVGISLLDACSPKKKDGAGSSTAPTASAVAPTVPTAAAALDSDAIKKYLGFDQLPATTLGAGKTIKLTAQVPLTGTFAYYGTVFSNGMKLAVKHVADMGGPTIDVTFQDSKSPDPQTVISGVREIAASGTQFMVSSVGGNFGAILPAVAAAKDLICLNTNMAYGVAPFVGAKNYWEPDGDIALCLPFVGEYLADAESGKSRFALVSSDQGATANKVLEGQVKDALPSGWSVSSSEFVPAGTNDYSSVVSHIASKNPDVVACALGSGAFGQFVKAFRQAGLTATIIVYGSPPSIDDFNAVGGVLAGVVYLGPLFNLSDPGNPWGDFFLKEYNAEYTAKPGLPDIYATCWYVNIFTWWQLWQQAWASGQEPTADLLNGYLEAGPTFKTLLGGDDSAPGTTTVNGETHFAVMVQGAYEIQADFGFKQIATSSADGTGYTAV